ncbi:MAG: nitroreductase family protein [Elusimicrobia bacterium]|nr:nitroreductase family protein [Elusimicrobiota bacterium]
MDALKALTARKSVRSYAKKAVPERILEKVVNAARLAPSACNVQAWEFVVVTDAGLLSALAALCDYGSFIKDAGAAVIVASKDTKYYLEDGCAASENILIAAAACGLGGCWVAGDKKKYAPKVLDLAGLPEDYRLVSVLALGYPRAKSAGVPKRPLSEVLHWQQFNNKAARGKR